MEEKKQVDMCSGMATQCGFVVAEMLGFRQSDPLPVGKRATAALVKFLREHPDAAPEAIYRQLHDDGVMPKNSDRNAWPTAPLYMRAYFTIVKATLPALDDFMKSEKSAREAAERAKKPETTSGTKLSAGKIPVKRTILDRVSSVVARVRAGKPSIQRRKS